MKNWPASGSIYEANATPGIYTLELRASTHPDFPKSAYHVEVDGTPVTPSIVLPDTGDDHYQWTGTKQIGGQRLTVR